MYLTGDYTFNGIPVTNAIAAVSFIWFRRPYEMTFQVPIYANGTQQEANNPLVSATYAIPYVVEDGDVYGQCYDHLLTLPEYAGWTLIP